MDEGHVHPAIRQSGPAHVDEMQLFARVHEHIAVAQVAVREHRVLARQRRPQPLQQVLGRGQVRPGFQVVVPVAQVIGQQVFQLAQAKGRARLERTIRRRHRAQLAQRLGEQSAHRPPGVTRAVSGSPGTARVIM